MKKIIFCAMAMFAASLLAACGGSSADAFVASGATTRLDSITFCGTTTTNASASGCPANPPSTTDVVGGGFWNTVDVYYTSSATRAVIFLHGGGGTNYGLANELGLNSQNVPSTTANINFQWLSQNGIIAVFPQGRGNVQLNGNTGGTWSNHVMTSGQDDLTFLQALTAYVKTQYNVSTVDVFGHSNGGMMANRVWCESPTTFDAYVSAAGPMAQYYVSTGSNICLPTTVQPYYGIIGDSDTVICDNGNVPASLYGTINPGYVCANDAVWDYTISPTWTINPTYQEGNPSAWVDPTPMVLNESATQLFRVNGSCGETFNPNDPVVQGNNNVWTNCGGKMQLQEVIGANHALAYGHDLCGVTNPDACSIEFVSTGKQPGGTDLLDDWIVPFLKNN